MLQHDVVNPHPDSRINAIKGVKGEFRDFPPRIYFDGAAEEVYTTLDQYKDRYEHVLWKSQGELVLKLGADHEGVGFLMVFRLIECMRKGLVPKIDVYDAAAWSAPGPLSEACMAQGSAPVKFPDFTRALWKQKRATLES